MRKLFKIIPFLIVALNATDISNKDINTVKKIMSLETKLNNCFIKLVGLEHTSAVLGGEAEICNRSVVVNKLTCDKGTNRKHRKAIKKAEAQRRECLKIDSDIRDNIFKLRKTPFKIPVSIGG